MSRTCESCTQFAPVTEVQGKERKPTGHGYCTLAGDLYPRQAGDTCGGYFPTLGKRINNALSIFIPVRQ